MANDPTFLELIQIHEQRWGSQGYPGRPTLKELMECPIVAVWVEAGRFTLSTYESAEQINEAASFIFTTPGPGSKKLVKIFYKGQPMKFSLQIIRLQAEKPSDTSSPEITDLSRGATYQPQIVDVNPQRSPRYSEVKEIKPAHYGESAPARNQLIPGRKTRLLKGRK